MGAHDELFVADKDGIRYPPPLKSLCIKLVADHIDSVAEFGDISTETKIRIAEILSKERKLSNANLPLFLGLNEEQVRLFDCSKVDEKGLRLVPAYSPNIRVLELGFCGHLTDSLLDLISEKCVSLASIALHGAYLVSDAAWGRLFCSKRIQLTKLDVENSPRICRGAIEQLVYGRALREEEAAILAAGAGAKDEPPLPLAELRLAKCSSLGSDAITHLTRLHTESLWYLCLSQLSETLDSNVIADMIRRFGPKLRELDISSNALADDKVLEAISATCARIRKLDLSALPYVTEQGLLALFSGIQSSLVSIRLSRLAPEAVTDDVLAAIVRVSAPSLTELTLNGADMLSRPTFGIQLPKLELLDVSWIRSVDDFVLKDLIDEQMAPSLKVIRVFGCNKVTEVRVGYHIDRNWKLIPFCALQTGARKRWISKDGGLVTVIGSEFD